MQIHVLGVAAIVFFYVLILAVGIWAGRKSKGQVNSEEVMLAGRNIGLIVSIFTMTATWVGGAYINGTAEMVFSNGLIYCQAPIGYAISLIFGGLLFANKMRSAGYVTMLDPFQRKYGERMGGLLYLPALLGEVCWTAAILSALGSTLSVIMNLNFTMSIIISAIIAIVYTLFGGLYSVAYTDVVQLFCIFFGLWLCVPFALMHPAVKDITTTATEWTGSLPSQEVGPWVDTYLLLIFGGVPWQVYFQRVLSSKTARRAQLMSYVAAFGCVVLGMPAFFLGVAAKSCDWNQTKYVTEDNKPVPIPPDDHKMILPMVMEYLCPDWVTFIGLGAVSAAVMSSADSSVLSAASMFARNIYKLIFRQKASEREIIIVMRVAIFGTGALATAMGILVESIYGLWYICADLIYVILFPQLVSVVYLEGTNTYGSLAGYIVGLTLRLMGGETLIGLQPAFCYFDMCTYTPINQTVTSVVADLVTGVNVSANATVTSVIVDSTTTFEMRQLFPFKTFAMLMSFATVILVSYPTKFIFERGLLPKHMDVFQCVVNISDESLALRDKLYDVNTNGDASKRGGGEGGADGHVTSKREAVAALHSNINPALKFSREDIINISETKQLQHLVIEDDPPTTKFNNGS